MESHKEHLNKDCLYQGMADYLSINCVRTNRPTLCPIVWLPYAPKYVYINKATCLSERFYQHIREGMEAIQ